MHVGEGVEEAMEAAEVGNACHLLAPREHKRDYGMTVLRRE